MRRDEEGRIALRATGLEGILRPVEGHGRNRDRRPPGQAIFERLQRRVPGFQAEDMAVAMEQGAITRAPASARIGATSSKA